MNASGRFRREHGEQIEFKGLKSRSSGNPSFHHKIADASAV